MINYLRPRIVPFPTVSFPEGSEELRALLSDWPGDRPRGWEAYVNQAITPKELARLELSEKRGQPYGEDAWVGKIVTKLGLEHTVRREGRPRKQESSGR